MSNLLFTIEEWDEAERVVAVLSRNANLMIAEAAWEAADIMRGYDRIIVLRDGDGMIERRSSRRVVPGAAPACQPLPSLWTVTANDAATG
jgi:hypothetical protein